MSIDTWIKNKGNVAAWRTFTGALWPGEKKQYEFVEVMYRNHPGFIFTQYMRPIGSNDMPVEVAGSAAYFSVEEFNKWIAQKDVHK